MFEELTNQANAVAEELIQTAKLKKGQILVVGCSTSEVCGSRIGSNSNLDAAKAVFAGIYKAVNDHGIYLAAQCCEHLNRALIVEAEYAEKAGLDTVNVVPFPKAGGSFATTAYAEFKEPVAVEEIRADAGLDIGDTFIGMHLKRVAVPVRLANHEIGEAHITAARVRPKYIGGERAHYDETLM
ncbi:MAG: TIGR01440 family protein [Lachnospiraceae bacterium]|nr:TIGR01440 family protein [Lachnospiraceae bacterium]